MKLIFAICLTFGLAGSALANSERARKKSTVGVAARAGLALGLDASPGFEAFVQLGPDWQIGLSLFHIQWDVTDALQKAAEDDNTVFVVSDPVVNKADVIGTSAVIQSRYFFGNSFNFGMGLGFRQYKVEMNISDDVASLDIEAMAQSGIAQITLGNQWQFDSGFVLGFDWVGFQYASKVGVSSSTTFDSLLPVPEPEQGQEFADEMAEGLAGVNLPLLFLLSIGWAF